MKKLPLLISVPHGGTQIPPEITDHTSLTFKDIFDDGDALTREIYHLKNSVIAYIDTPVARACIDLNRAPEDRPPDNPDGIVKTMTTMQTPVYKKNKFPDNSLIEKLLTKYYYPYHQQLDALQKQTSIRLAVDCHSMLPMSPPISQTPNQPRPLFCLSNRGNENGNIKVKSDSITCQSHWLITLKKCICQVFKINDDDVLLNNPFSGGYITKAHFNGTVPWIQLEINRKLYLTPPYFNPKTLHVSSVKIFELQKKILDAFYLFFTYI